MHLGWWRPLPPSFATYPSAPLCCTDAAACWRPSLLWLQRRSPLPTKHRMSLSVLPISSWTCNRWWSLDEKREVSYRFRLEWLSGGEGRRIDISVFTPSYNIFYWALGGVGQVTLDVTRLHFLELSRKLLWFYIWYLNQSCNMGLLLSQHPKRGRRLGMRSEFQ